MNIPNISPKREYIFIRADYFSSIQIPIRTQIIRIIIKLSFKIALSFGFCTILPL